MRTCAHNPSSSALHHACTNFAFPEIACQYVTFRVSWLFCRYCPTISSKSTFHHMEPLLLHDRSSFHARGPATFSIFFPILSLAPVLLQQQPIDEWRFILQRQDTILVRCVLLFSQRRCPPRCSPTHAAVRAHRRFPIQRPFSMYSCSAVMRPNALLYVMPGHGQQPPNGVPVVAVIRHPLGARPPPPWDDRWPSAFEFVVIPVS
jgi:hypothetical protein